MMMTAQDAKSHMLYDKIAKEECLLRSEHVRATVG